MIVSPMILKPRKILLPPFPKKRFEVIQADLPWKYRDEGKSGKRGASQQYQTMELMDLINLPIERIAAKNCALLLWATDPMMPEALTVLKAWNFTYKRVAFVWIKMTKDMKKPRMNLGRWTRSNAEFVLLGTRGSPKVVNRGINQVVLTPQLPHSVKPLEVQDRIDKLFGEKRSIELFARNVNKKKKNWTYYGDQI